MQTFMLDKAGLRRVLALLAIALSLMTFLTLVPRASALAEETGTVTATELFMREKPSTDSDKLKTLKEGAKVTILGKDGSWYKISYGNTVGYVAKKYISTSGSSDTGSQSGSIAALGDAPKGSKLGDSGSHVKKLQQALAILGYYDGKISGNFGELTEKAVKAFQKAKGLSADGVAGSGTIKAIFGSAPAGSSKVKTEKPQWFNGGQNLIPKDAVFTIKDVRTGRTFKARRWSGSNHIDAEPYNAEATATLKNNYGGSFSWDRRPILISYNGHVYAASMNGYPHGTQTIKNNDFEGHFCIHFAGSKTHETDRVDEDHQAAVNEAAKAGW